MEANSQRGLNAYKYIHRDLGHFGYTGAALTPPVNQQAMAKRNFGGCAALGGQLAGARHVFWQKLPSALPAQCCALFGAVHRIQHYQQNRIATAISCGGPT